MAHVLQVEKEVAAGTWKWQQENSVLGAEAGDLRVALPALLLPSAYAVPNPSGLAADIAAALSAATLEPKSQPCTPMHCGAAGATCRRWSGHWHDRHSYRHRDTGQRSGAAASRHHVAADDSGRRSCGRGSDFPEGNDAAAAAARADGAVARPRVPAADCAYQAERRCCGVDGGQRHRAEACRMLAIIVMSCLLILTGL